MAGVKISHFMRQAMFDVNDGYYLTRNPLGKNADFITAPEISQVFGELIAAYLLQTTSKYAGRISLVEMGAGRGVLFHDILLTITRLAKRSNPLAIDFLARADFHIIEINPLLTKIQQEKLAEFSIKWHDNFADFLNEINRIILVSNELFDCFPIDQFVNTDIGWCERLVDGNRFITKSFDEKTHQFVRERVGVNVPFGAVFEFSEEAESFMSQLALALKKHGGMALNFDYGYFKTEFANTLQAIKSHQKVDPLQSPGTADLTAHVNFEALEQIAKSHGLNSSLVTQREFLISLGVEERRKKLSEQSSAIDRLIAPDQMGELFKCHIVWSDN